MDMKTPIQELQEVKVILESLVGEDICQKTLDFCIQKIKCVQCSTETCIFRLHGWLKGIYTCVECEQTIFLCSKHEKNALKYFYPLCKQNGGDICHKCWIFLHDLSD